VTNKIPQNIKRLLSAIREKRISQKLSQREAALLAGMRKNQWQKIEAGIVDARVNTLMSMIAAVKLSVKIEID